MLVTKMIKKLLPLTLLLPLGNAQAIVNLQDIHTKELEAGFHGAVGLEFSGASGNSDKSNSTLSTQLHWKKPSYSNILLMDYSYGEANEEVNTDEAFLHLRHIHDINSEYAWEVFNQIQQDRFSRLTFRGLLGGGMRYKQVGDGHRLIYGIGAFYKKERLSKQSIDPNEPRSSSSWHGNLYMIAAQKLSENSNVFGTVYYQPQLDETDDYRILLTAGIKVKVDENLSLQIGIDGEYDSKPPATVEDYDISYRSGLEYRF